LSAAATMGHARAVEAERKEHHLAAHAVERRGDLRLGHGERVTEVQAAVHVRVRERGQILLATGSGRGVLLERALGLPHLLHVHLDRAEEVLFFRGHGYFFFFSSFF
jgi:hypothetical protein